MENFVVKHMHLIDEYCSTMTKIERAVFIHGNILPKKQKEILFNYSIAMLYSIWEGFVSRSFRLYIEYLNEQNISYENLLDSIVVYNMESQFKQFKEYPADIRKKGKFFLALSLHYNTAPPKLNVLVDTKNNVGFNVLNNLLTTFGIEAFPEYWETYKHPDTTLKEIMLNFLRYRNAIAHGADISGEKKIEHEQYEVYRTLIRNLMYAMHNRFLDAITNKTYIKSQ